MGCVPLLDWKQLIKAHLSCGNELKGSQCGLQVGGVGLEVIESASDAGLELGWLLARWARGRDLVEGAHDCGCREMESFKISRKCGWNFDVAWECVLAKVGQPEFCHVSTSALSDVSLFSTHTISSTRDGFYWII